VVSGLRSRIPVVQVAKQIKRCFGSPRVYLPTLPCFGSEEISTHVVVADIDKVVVFRDDFRGRYFSGGRLNRGANNTCDAASSASRGPKEPVPLRNVCSPRRKP